MPPRRAAAKRTVIESDSEEDARTVGAKGDGKKRQRDATSDTETETSDHAVRDSPRKRKLNARGRMSMAHGASLSTVNATLAATNSATAIHHTPTKHGGNASGPRTPKIAALRRAGLRKDLSLDDVNIGGGGLGEAAGAKVTWEVMNTKYEEWIKMATDNKINANNTWNLALIDYFADSNLTLLRSQNDGSINFAKASATLDGCVKIWTSRVDSMVVELGKLNTAVDTTGTGRDGGDGLDPGEGDGNSDDEGRQKREKRKAVRPTATLADDFAKLKLKEGKDHLEFKVDPLFKKTSADFDEGGAGGLLLNHLGVDGQVRVVFDAGDAIPEEEEEDEDTKKARDQEYSSDLVDVLKLRETFLQDLSQLRTRTICPSLTDFKLTTSSNTIDLNFFQRLPGPHPKDEEIDEVNPSHDINAGGPEQDFFEVTRHLETGGDPLADELDGGGDLGGVFDFAADPGSDGEEGGVMELGGAFAEGGGMGRGPLEPFDPRRLPNERELVMALKDGEEGETDMFDYFDRNLVKNWAGPEHWKMRRIGAVAALAKKTVGEGDDSTGKRKRQPKEKEIIDFTRSAEVSTKDLFASGKASITLPKRKGKRKDDYTLPDDMHFSSTDLLRMFLKPRVMLTMRRRSAAGGHGPTGGRTVGEDQQEVDERYWAQAAAEAANPESTNDGDDQDMPALPFNTQFFADDEDDLAADFEEELGDLPPIEVDREEDDLLAATQGKLKRVRPEAVNYAKRTKRVDVRKLKETIWRELEDGLAAKSDEKKKEGETFKKVMNGLEKVYPTEKLADISTSFCFICLLHLANEKGLAIKKDSLESSEKTVGGLDNLWVYKDVNVAVGGGNEGEEEGQEINIGGEQDSEGDS